MNDVLVSRLKKLIKRILFIKDYDQVEFLKKKGLKVGRNFNILEGCIIDYSHSWHIEIGDDVTLAPRVHILAHDASTWPFLGYTKVKNVKIGDRVFIGAGSIIMPGVTIGNDVIIGAGSVVTNDVANNSVFAGNPAKFIIYTDDYIRKEKEKMRPENTFGREFSEARNVTHSQKQVVKDAAEKYGTAYLE